MSYFSQLTQSVTPDTNNSYSGSGVLTTGMWWAGVASSTLNVAGLQVMVKTDQDGIIYIDQANKYTAGVGTVTTNGSAVLAGSSTKFTRDFVVGDQIWVTGETVRTITIITSDVSLTVSSAFSTTAGGLAFNQYYWDLKNSFYYFVLNPEGRGFTTQAIGSFWRVRFQNTSASSTTFFRLDSVLCPIVEAVPRAVSEEGNLKVAIKENTATISTLNSTTNIAGNTTWSGTFEEITNQSAIQFILKYDQNTTIYVEQSLAGSVADITDTFYGEANVGFAQTIASVGPYYRIRVTNQNVVTQATGSITSAKTALLSAFPRSLDHNGNFKISSPTDDYGWDAENTPQGETRTITPYRLVGAQMDFVANAGAVDPNFWLTSVDVTAGPGTVVVNNSLCSLNSGTNAASFSKLASTRRARYVGGHSNRFRANLRLSTNQASNTKRWGMAVYSNYTFTVSASTSSVGDVYSNNSQTFTVMQANAGGTTLYCWGTGAPAASGNLTKVSGAAGSTATVAYSAFAASWTISDGLMFQMAGSTFSVQTFKNGTATPITSFNGHLGSAYTIDTNINTYEIYYTNAKAYFVVNGETLHTVSATTTNLCATMHYQIYMDNINSGNTTNTVLGMRNAVIHRLGPAETAPLWKYIHGVNAGVVLKYGPGRLHSLTVNDSATGTAVSLYDALSAVNPIALIAIGANNLTPFTFKYDLDFYTGLYVVTANGATDITCVYE